MSERGDSDMAAQQQQQEASDSSNQQVVRYKAFHQFHNHVENSLGLRRVLIQKLPDQANLDGCYIGGRIVNVVSLAGTHGAGGGRAGSMVFVKDDGDFGMETLHGMLVISQELMDQLPTLNDQFMLFVGGASLEKSDEDEETMFTQDTGKNVIVEGTGVTLWVIHPRIDDPKLYQKTSFQPEWWTRAKGKRKRKKMAGQFKEQRKRERLAGSVAGGGGPLAGPGLSTISDGSRGYDEGEEQLSCKPGPSNVDYMDGVHEGGERSSSNPQSSEQVTTLKDGINRASGEKSSSLSKPGSSDVSSIIQGGGRHSKHHQSTDFVSEQSFPDITDFPDSAFSGSQGPQQMDVKEGEGEGGEEEEEGGGDSSSDGGDSSSSWRESESDTTDLPEVNWTPKQRSKTSYSYTKLGDLQAGLKKANVIGVVKEFNAPRVTRGTEYCSVLTLLDETDPLVGVKCVLFNTEKERLPHVKREGDIICLRRVNTHDYRNVMQIEGPPYSSSLRFSPRVSRKMKPCTGSRSYSFTAAERRRVRELREWLQQRTTEHAHTLESIRGGQKCNFTCQVVWVAHFASPDHTVLSVWDGSDCPLVIKSFDTAGADVRCDAGLNVVIGPKLQRQIIIKSRLPPSLKVNPRSYIHISNIEASAQDKDGVTELCLDRNPQENIKNISASDSEYSELLERLEAGLASQRGVAITTTIHNDIALSSLIELKDYDVKEDVPGKCHSMVKLVRVLTPSVEETVWLMCDRCSYFELIPKAIKTDESGVCLDPCPGCSKPPTSSGSPILHCVFLIKVLFADHTASLEVCIPQVEIGILFGDLKPTNLYQHQAARYQVMSKLYQLSGGNPPFSEEIGDKIRPWIDCSLVKIREGEVLAYGIFDTTLK